MKKLSLLLTLALLISISALAQNAPRFVEYAQATDNAQIIKQGAPVSIVLADKDNKGLQRACHDLAKDINAVSGAEAKVVSESDNNAKIVVATINGGSDFVKQLIKKKKIDPKQLNGKIEKFIIKMIDGQLVILGSDKRGAIYGVYELSEQMGVSPWYWWADVPVEKHDVIYIKSGEYTAGEPVVRYRGIFLNDEAPCLSSWVKEKFPDSECPTANPALARGMNSNFYEHVFELMLRLKANYMWPAMWGNAFYADDSRNSELAKEMGIIMGTSHHEPMARNHQEWARHRKENGPWDYDANQQVIDKFFREGVRRAKDNEDLITIGMRGDGDTGLGGKEGHDDEYQSEDEKNLRLMERIFKNQRQIIAEETGKPAEKRQQIWALYKEVQHLYDIGLRVPDDVLILLCDDNWGNIRKVPNTQHKGGWGMYYHVDYVGAPRSTKWTNVTPIAHLWEQMNLCVEYGIDRLWILNVGDLKPMEYPIDLFLRMAWNPNAFNAQNFRQHTLEFCKDAFGGKNAKAAAHIIEKYSTYNGRVTPEMLNTKTYNLHSGEFKEAVNEYKALEAEALRLYYSLDEQYKDAFYQLALYPVQSMANIYEMYYAWAQNQYLAGLGDMEANEWADKVDECFDRDSLLTIEYHSLNGGKWNHLMRQSHIGYKSWNDPANNIRPATTRLSDSKRKNAVAVSNIGYISIEAEHFYKANDNASAKWTVIPTYGRTKSAVALMPYNVSTEGASLEYKFRLPEGVKEVKVHVITNSTLPFIRHEGHRYNLSIDGGAAKEVNYNGDCVEENQWHMYDVVATRIIEKVETLSVSGAGDHVLSIAPIEPGLVVEKIVIDFGGYSKSHLFGTESQFIAE